MPVGKGKLNILCSVANDHFFHVNPLFVFLCVSFPGLLQVESDLNINDFLKPDTNSLQQQYRVYGWLVVRKPLQ